MSEAAFAPTGQVIEARYRIQRKIAEGGMATVYQALDERLNRPVAIKIMHTQLAQGPYREQFVERFRREAQSAAAIANPHIVQVYDTGEFNGLDFLVMEYVHGVNLRHEMNEQRTFSVRDTLRIMSEILDGLSSAHQAGVVHRDIKPENILINERGHVQITDFGLARAASQATLSSTGMLLGTAAYLAPEMIEHNQSTPQGDLYSVGVMAWEMLVGEVPFASDNPITLVFKHVHEDIPSLTTRCPGINPQVDTFITHLTARHVDARPQDATQALEELRTITSQLNVDDWQYRLTPTQPAAPLIATQPFDEQRTMTMPNTAPAGAIPPVPAPPTDTVSMDGNSLDSTIPVNNDASTRTDNALVDNTIPMNTTVSTGSAPSTSNTVSSDATMAIPTATSADTAVYGASSAVDVTNMAGADAPTQMITTGDVGSEGHDAYSWTQQLADLADTSTPTTTRSHHSRTPWLVAIITILVVALCAGGGSWWYFLGPGSYWTLPAPIDASCNQESTCPIRDVSWNAYAATLNVAGIPYTVKHAYDDTIAEGQVITTSPANVGDRVSKRHGSLTVTVSRGIKQATIPDDMLDTNSEHGKNPLTALKEAGFTHVNHDESKDEYSMDHPTGSLISIDPAPGTTTDYNTPITVVLSKGPMPVAMPNVVGANLDDAKNTLAELKLNVTTTEDFSDSIEQGDVISTSPQTNAQLHWGDTVTLTVSKGPQTATIPSGLIGKQEEDVTSQLEKLGFSVTSNKILGGLFGTVRDIKVGDQSFSDGGTVRLRDTNGKPTVITLTIV